MFGGHTDSWDVGQGAQDDGAGFMVSYEALYMIKKLGLRPARTIRLVGYAGRARWMRVGACCSHVCASWVCEEFGGVGAQQYFQAHKDEVHGVLCAAPPRLTCIRLPICRLHLKQISVSFSHWCPLQPPALLSSRAPRHIGLLLRALNSLDPPWPWQ
jgi:hypothetical protein